MIADKKLSAFTSAITGYAQCAGRRIDTMIFSNYNSALDYETDVKTTMYTLETSEGTEYWVRDPDIEEKMFVFALQQSVAETLDAGVFISLTLLSY